MKTNHNMLILCLLTFSLNLFGQKLNLINTKDLVEISEKYGLDSALKEFMPHPLYYIDEATTKELIKHIKNNEPSDIIEQFLVDYALCAKDTTISEILHDFFIRTRDKIKDEMKKDKEYLPYYNRWSLNILPNSFFALIENPHRQTDTLLLEYYEIWNEIATYYKKERWKKMLYKDFNHNCCVLQLFLKQMESPLYNPKKLKEHQKRLNYRVSIEKTIDCSKYTQVNVYKSIKLTKSYNSIGEINFEEETELKELIHRRNNRRHCWKWLIYNDKKGYLDVGCNYDINLFRLELKEDELVIHKIYGNKW